MPQISTKITNAVGLHARPAALFVETARRYSSDISVHFGNRVADAKSIINVLVLGVESQSTIMIEAQGEDADEALAALEQLVIDNFGEVA